MTGADVADETVVGSRLSSAIMQYLFACRQKKFLLPARKNRPLPTPQPS